MLEFIFRLGSKAAPNHDASSPMFHSWDEVFQVPSKQLTFGFICPQNILE